MRKRTGSIDETTDGQHRVRVTVNGERRTLGVYATRAEAEAQRAASADVLTREIAHQGVTLATWGEKCLTEREIGREVRDPDSDRSRWRKHVLTDEIAKMQIAHIRRRHVRAFVKRVRARVAEQTTKNVLNVVRVVLWLAVEEELLRDNPAKRIKVKPDDTTEEPWTFATPDEQAKLVDAVHGPEKWIVAFAIATGLRAGELVTLRLADVHVDDADPHVIVRYGTAPDLPTKSGKIRRVELLPHGERAARAWLAELPRFAPKNPHGLMFPRKRGGFRDENHVLRWEAWKAALERAGITRAFRWHDLRHTCASSLVSGWWGRMWSLLEVKEWLGHASITTTERYAHLAETALKRAARETRAAIGHELARSGATSRNHNEERRLPKPKVDSPILSEGASGKEGADAIADWAAPGQLKANSDAPLLLAGLPRSVARRLRHARGADRVVAEGLARAVRLARAGSEGACLAALETVAVELGLVEAAS